MADALRRANARGVPCRVLIDTLGSRNYLRSLLSKLRAAGVEVRTVLPLRLFGKRFTRPDLRNHRKIVIVDGQIGYTGSQNIVDAVFKPGMVADMQQVFAAYLRHSQPLQLSCWRCGCHLIRGSTRRCFPWKL